MPANPKFYNRGDVLFITASVEEGLALPPNVLINSMLLSVDPGAGFQEIVNDY